MYIDSAQYCFAAKHSNPLWHCAHIQKQSPYGQIKLLENKIFYNLQHLLFLLLKATKGLDRLMAPFEMLARMYELFYLTH